MEHRLAAYLADHSGAHRHAKDQATRRKQLIERQQKARGDAARRHRGIAAVVQTEGAVGDDGTDPEPLAPVVPPSDLPVEAAPAVGSGDPEPHGGDDMDTGGGDGAGTDSSVARQHRLRFVAEFSTPEVSNC